MINEEERAFILKWVGGIWIIHNKVFNQYKERQLCSTDSKRFVFECSIKPAVYSIKLVLTSRARIVNQYKNFKCRVLKCTANIHFD